MSDVAVGRENKIRRLEVRLSLVHAHVAPDRAGGLLRIEIVEDGKTEPKLCHRPARVFCVVGGKCDDGDAERFELSAVLLKVSQLLTAVASPVTTVEDDHGDASKHRVRQPHGAAVDGACFELRETLANTKEFHMRCIRCPRAKCGRAS